MRSESGAAKARVVGINHVALEVGDIDAALEFYGRIFEFSLRGRGRHAAFIDMGDQFINLSDKRTQGPDADRHFGLVVDDRAPVRRALQAMGVELLPGGGLDFLDPWGNRVQVVAYRDIQFTKAPEVLRAMRLDGLEKTEDAKRQLAKKGISPRDPRPGC